MGDEVIDLFEGIGEDNYRQMLPMILKEGYQFSKLNLFKGMMMLIRQRVGHDIMEDLAKATFQVYG